MSAANEMKSADQVRGMRLVAAMLLDDTAEIAAIIEEIWANPKTSRQSIEILLPLIGGAMRASVRSKTDARTIANGLRREFNNSTKD